MTGDVGDKKNYLYPAVDDLSFRPAADGDKDFIHTLHTAAFRDIVEKVFGGWKPEEQRKRFEKKWQDQEYIIARKDDEKVGVIWVEDQGDTLFFKEIMLAPPYQGQGIGTKIIKALQKQACDQGKDLLLQVFRLNRAHELYKRLGFEYEGETDTHFVMIYHCD